MVTIFLRIIKYGFQNFLRNGWLAAATISTMVLALIVFEGLIVFGAVGGEAMNVVESKIDISVYFKDSVAEDDILRIKRAVEGLPEVKNVDYISRNIALKNFQEKHSGEDVIAKSLSELGGNPLLASLNIKARTPNEYSVIASYFGNESLKPFVEKVSYSENQKVIDRLSKIIDATKRGALALTAILSFIAGLIVFNTIRLAIYSNREEIGIMRLIGASNNFIRGPYIFEGLIYGLFAAIVSVLILIPVAWYASPYLEVFIPGMNLWNYFLSSIFIIFGYQLLFGILLSVISSVIAVNRYLRI